MYLGRHNIIQILILLYFPDACAPDEVYYFVEDRLKPLWNIIQLYKQFI